MCQAASGGSKNPQPVIEQGGLSVEDAMYWFMWDEASTTLNKQYCISRLTHLNLFPFNFSGIFFIAQHNALKQAPLQWNITTLKQCFSVSIQRASIIAEQLKDSKVKPSLTEGDWNTVCVVKHIRQMMRKSSSTAKSEHMLETGMISSGKRRIVHTPADSPF